MFSTLRTRFGIPGVISVMALVFAMFGGAYAASNSSDGGKATASAKAKKGPRGPKGPKGDTGPQGPAGPAGPAGAKGEAGAPGANGSNGVGVTTAPAGAECPAGGIKVTSASGTSKVCNGEEGEQGSSGEPWTAGGVLPPGATETGAYVIGSETGSGIAGGSALASISFPIPLPSTLPLAQIKFVKTLATPPAECENSKHAGTAGASNPEAAPGYLCVYAAISTNLNDDEAFFLSPGGFGSGASVSGTTLSIEPIADEEARGEGTWAVTAPEAP